MLVYIIVTLFLFVVCPWRYMQPRKGENITPIRDPDTCPSIGREHVYINQNSVGVLKRIF